MELVVTLFGLISAPVEETALVPEQLAAGLIETPPAAQWSALPRDQVTVTLAAPSDVDPEPYSVSPVPPAERFQRSVAGGLVDTELTVSPEKTPTTSSSVAELTVSDATISVRYDTAKSVTYAELVGGQRFDIALTGNNINVTRGVADVKPVNELRVVGQSIQRYDIPAKVDGSLTWAIDV